MININEFLEELLTERVEKIVAERIKIAIEQVSQEKPPEKEFYSIKEVVYIFKGKDYFVGMIYSIFF